MLARALRRTGAALLSASGAFPNPTQQAHRRIATLLSLRALPVAAKYGLGFGSAALACSTSSDDLWLLAVGARRLYRDCVCAVIIVTGE